MGLLAKPSGLVNMLLCTVWRDLSASTYYKSLAVYSL